MAAAVESKLIGTHELRLEDDILFLIQRGDYTLSDASQVSAAIEAVLARRGRAFVMVDQTHAGKTPPEVRRYLAEWNKKHKASGAALFGGSAASRAVATLVLTAIRVFRAEGMQTTFVANEADARAWIAAQRAKLLP